MIVAVVLVASTQLPAAEESPPREAFREINRVRMVLNVSSETLTDRSSPRSSLGRPTFEIEGWRRDADGNLWPVDQATFDLRSGQVSKYVNFTFASRRKRGEAILPMGAISARGDSYLRLLYPGWNLSLEQIDRKRVIGKASIYYELWYSPQPQEVPFFHPLVKLLLDASTGRFYRVELAPDYLGVGKLPGTILSRNAAARVAGVFLRATDLVPYLGQGTSVSAVLSPELSFVRPNSWLGGIVPEGGTARAAWVVPFKTLARGEARNLLFIDASGGRVIGGIAAPP